MQDPIKHDQKKPGLEEAIHPEIGNESTWVPDKHSFSLSTPDPLKSMDHQLLDEETRSKIISQWTIGDTEKKELETIPTPIPVDIPHVIIPPIQPMENEPKEIQPDYPVESKKERKKKEKAELKFSKRIKKVAEKVKKEEKSSRVEKAAPGMSSEETNLSPFTNWLKGLRGSEYVHPYHDDYALHQGGDVPGEGISETFADLLAAQGYKDQAIAMYTQLIEKFPEKSRFFAAKIEALQ